MKAIVGLDFVDEDGVRRFSFQVCDQRNGRFETVAMLNTQEPCGTVAGAHFCAVDSFPHSRRAVERLARIYMERSVPQVFRKAAQP